VCGGLVVVGSGRAEGTYECTTARTEDKAMQQLSLVSFFSGPA
jgi:hypothetical protein